VSGASGVVSIGGDAFTADGSGLSYIGPVAICPARITDAQAVIVDAMLTAGCTGVDLFRWFRDHNYEGTLVLPLDGDSRGYVVSGCGLGDSYSYTAVDATTDTGYEVYA
jgi:hypothetical protein